MSLCGEFDFHGTKAGIKCKKLTVQGSTALTFEGGEMAVEATDIEESDWLTYSKPAKGTIKDGKYYEL